MLRINLEYRRGILFVRLDGDLVEETASEISMKLTKIIEESGLKYVVYNMKKVEVIDSIGLEAINETCLAVSNNKGKTILCELNNFLRRTIKASNLLYAYQEIKNEGEVMTLIG